MDEGRRSTVADVVLEPLRCLPSDTPLRVVARVLASKKQGSVVVQWNPVLVVTERVVIDALAKDKGPETPAATVAVAPDPVVHESAPLFSVLRAMIDTHQRSLVVVDRDDRPLGLVTLTAVLAALFGAPPWVGALRMALHIEGGVP